MGFTEDSVDGVVDVELAEMVGVLTAAARQEVSVPLTIVNDADTAVIPVADAWSTYSPAEAFTLGQVQASAAGSTPVAIVVLGDD